jgi:RNA polymerase sigma factor (sigma-70 family)
MTAIVPCYVPTYARSMRAIQSDQFARVTLTPMRTFPVVGSPIEEPNAWAATLDNDGKAFAVVFDLHRDRVYHHALRMTTNVNDAEDVVAAAFFELWRLRKSVRVVDGSVLPWLLVTTTNLSRNLTRGIRRYRALVASLPRSTEVRSSEDVALEEIDLIRLATNVREAIRTLAPEDAALILLTTFEHYSSAQVGAALGISDGAARTRLHRARTRLAAALQSLEQVDGDFTTKEKNR